MLLFTFLSGYELVNWGSGSCGYLNTAGRYCILIKKAVPSWKKRVVLFARSLNSGCEGLVCELLLQAKVEAVFCVFVFANQMVVELDSEYLMTLGFNSWFSSLQGDTSKKHAGQIILSFILIHVQEVNRALQKLLHGLARNGGFDHNWSL